METCQDNGGKQNFRTLSMLTASSTRECKTSTACWSPYRHVIAWDLAENTRYLVLLHGQRKGVTNTGVSNPLQLYWWLLHYFSVLDCITALNLSLLYIAFAFYCIIIMSHWIEEDRFLPTKNYRKRNLVDFMRHPRLGPVATAHRDAFVHESPSQAKFVLLP